jgi:hypothetical protein
MEKNNMILIPSGKYRTGTTKEQRENMGMIIQIKLRPITHYCFWLESPIFL